MGGCDIRHRIASRRPRKMVERRVSREAAQECSPRRKPWVARKKMKSPGGAQEKCPALPAAILFCMTLSTLVDR